MGVAGIRNVQLLESDGTEWPAEGGVSFIYDAPGIRNVQLLESDGTEWPAEGGVSFIYDAHPPGVMIA